MIDGRLEGSWRCGLRPSVFRYFRGYSRQRDYAEHWVKQQFGLFLLCSTIIFFGRFVVLEHDLYAQTVDLAIGYTLPAALNFTPTLKVRSFPI